LAELVGLENEEPFQLLTMLDRKNPRKPAVMLNMLDLISTDGYQTGRRMITVVTCRI
jgi:hypothetical protein